MKTIEIYNDKITLGKDTYNFIIKETWFDGWGITYSKGRTRPKMYEIKKNDETILSTSLYQTFYSYKKKLMQYK